MGVMSDSELIGCSAKLRRLSAVGVIILIIGFIIGFFTALLFQSQVLLATGAGVVTLGILAFVISRPEWVSLMKDLLILQRNEEIRVKSATYKVIEHLFTDLHRELFLAKNEAGKFIFPSQFTPHLLAFQKILRDAEANGELRHVVRDAPEVNDALHDVQQKIISTNIDTSHGKNIGNDETQSSSITAAISAIETWFKKWDQWRS